MYVCRCTVSSQDFCGVAVVKQCDGWRHSPCAGPSQRAELPIQHRLLLVTTHTYMLTCIHMKYVYTCIHTQTGIDMQ